MSVTVDDSLLAAEELGLATVGEVLSHLQKDNRLVVNLLIDGQEPNFERMASVRKAPLKAHTIFIETTEPRKMALEVIAHVEIELKEADRLKNEAVDQFQANAVHKAMEKLSGCFSTWMHAVESIKKTTQLLRINLEAIAVADSTLGQFLTQFCAQLRQIKAGLESRDFVTVADILTYETARTSERWILALGSIREVLAEKKIIAR